jgi:hypothetical protein
MSDHRWRRRSWLLGLLLVAAVAGADDGFAQAITTGTIEAVVADAQGGMLPGATVALRNVQQGTVQSQATDARGAVRFLAVPVGVYELRAELQGFNTAVVERVQVNPGRRRTGRRTANRTSPRPASPAGTT